MTAPPRPTRPARPLLAGACLAVLLPAAGLGAQQPTAPGGAGTVAVAAAQDAPLVLESHLWRNFQPSTGAPDSALTGLLRVSAADRGALPRGMRVERATLTAGERTWTVAPLPGHVTLGDEGLELLMRGGPAWPVGAAVDVLVDLRDARGRAWRLVARAQVIRRLD